MANGRFCWFDLTTTDTSKAKAFYEALFGWKVDDATSYHHIQNAKGQHLGGMMPPPAPGIAPHWLGYVEVASLDETVARIGKAGGKILMEHAIESGRFAVFTSPQGVHLAAYEHTKKGEGAEPDPRQPGNFCWYEVMAPDPVAEAKFLGAVFGWTSDAQDMGGEMYYVLKDGDAMVGGCMKTPKDMPIPPSWQFYVGTRSVDESAARVKDLGGQIVVPPTDIPNIGRFAVAIDPTGAAINLFQGG